MPQQRKKKERSERLRGERDQIKFIDLRFERWQVVRFRKARGRQEYCHVTKFEVLLVKSLSTSISTRKWLQLHA